MSLSFDGDSSYLARHDDSETHRSVFFLLSYSGEPFLSHLTIDSLSVLTRDPIPGIFEFGSKTLGECFLGPFVFDEFARKTGDTSSDSPSW